MKFFIAKFLLIALSLSLIAPSTFAYGLRNRLQSSNGSIVYNNQTYNNNTYNYGTQSTNTMTQNSPCGNFSNVSVGVGTLPNGIQLSIASNDSSIISCIKNTSWLSYFSRFGNGVTLQVSNTWLGVQVTATSYDSSTISAIQNAAWTTIITGASANNIYYNTPTYTTPTYNNYYTPAPVVLFTPSYDNYNYRSGTTIFGNVSQIARSLAYIPSGVRMTLVSGDYNTMLYLQQYSFTFLYAHLTGISISKSNISGGVEITVTAWSTSTINEIQNIGYAIIYR